MTFEANYAARRGGALFADFGAVVTLDGCAFERNAAGALGGALFADDRASRAARGGENWLL